MQIQEIHVDGYGVWRDLALARSDAPITVVHGDNEAGKSTLMQFLREMLYGLSDGRSKYLPPADQGPAGGQLSLKTATFAWSVQREWICRDGTWTERCEWRRCRDDRWEKANEPPELQQTDRATFNNVYCLGLADLIAVAQLDATAAGELLYSLSTGLDRVTLSEAVASLRQDRLRLEDASESPAEKVFRDLRRSEERAAELAAKGTEWLELNAELDSCRESLQQLQERHATLSHDRSQLDAAQRTWDQWQALRELEEAQAQSPFASDEKRQVLRKWQRLEAKRRHWMRVYRQQRAKFRQLKQQIAALELNDAVATNRRLIEVLVDQQPRLVWLQAQMDTSPHATHVDPNRDEAAGVAPEIFAMLERHAASLQSAQLECDRLEATLVEGESEPKHEPAAADSSDLAARIRSAGERVQTLRRRLQLKQRLDKMARHREELQQETEELLEQQVLPPHVLAYLGIPFVVGMMLVLAGVFWGAAAKLGWPVALLGLAGWIAAVVIKVILERTAERELAEAEEQLGTLQRQIANARKEAEQLDQSLTPSTATLEERLAEAERELEALERQSPAVRRASQGPANVADQLERAYARRDQAERQWQQALQRAQLPSETNPDQLADIPICAAVSVTVPGGHQIDALRHEYEVLSGRIHRLARECAISSQNGHPVELLDELHRAYIAERQCRQRKQKLIKRARRVRVTALAVRRRLRRCNAQRRRLRRTLDIRNADRHRLASAWSAYQATRKEAKAVREALRESLGSDAAWNEVRQIAWECDGDEVSRRCHETHQQLTALEAEINALHEKRGELRERRRQIALNPECDQHRQRALRAQSQLTSYTQRWASLALADRLLEQLQRRYEHERQPHTLRDASRYFHFLTGRQYDRVWTPWDQACLLVETVAGEHRQVDELSTGTRELLFLALRLAIVAHFARHGIRLPLILDDVLVNLDRTRLQAACELLAAFADEGHQVLFFTCHEHVVEAFTSVGAAVVRLDAKPTAIRPVAATQRPVAEPASAGPATESHADDADDSDEWEGEWDEGGENFPHEEQNEADEVDGEWEWVEDDEESHVAEELDEEDEDFDEYDEDDEEEYAETLDGEHDPDEEFEDDLVYEEATATAEDELDDDSVADEDDEEWVEEVAEEDDEFAEAEQVESVEASEDDVTAADGGSDTDMTSSERRFTWDSPERWQRPDGEAA